MVNQNLQILLILLLPFLLTCLGGGLVFSLKSGLNQAVERLIIGFAAGVMVAASIWSLLLPALDYAQDNLLPVLFGFLLGIFGLLIFDSVLPHAHLDGTLENSPNLSSSETFEVISTYRRVRMLVAAVTLHNIPEGLAVGVSLAAALNGNISLTSALVLSLGIAIQNLPEGAIVSLPLRVTVGISKAKSFLYSVASGIVEPIASIIALLLVSVVSLILPYALSFAAGAMIYVVIEELIPSTQSLKSENKKWHSNYGVIGFALGFALMMSLDVALG